MKNHLNVAMVAMLFGALIYSGLQIYNLSKPPRHYTVGECMARKSEIERQAMPKESWEETKEPIEMELIVQVGQRKYLTVTDYGRGRMMQGTSDIAYDNIMVPVECSDRLKQLMEELKNGK